MGWVTGSTSEKSAGVAAQTAVVQAFVPLCVAKAEEHPDQLLVLKKENSYSRYDFVTKSGDGFPMWPKNTGATSPKLVQWP
jgi:hypothetical protein